MNSKKLSLMFLFVLTSVGLVFAQAQCEGLVQQAVDTASTNCDGLRRNEACYGNVMIDAEAVADVEEFIFDTAGNTVPVSDLASLRLSSRVEQTGEWGISLMHLQANILDEETVPISMVLFGDVDIQNNVVGESVRLSVTALTGVNVRRAPVDGAVIGSLTSGQETVAFGRNGAGTWVLIEIPDTNDSGWVSADFVRGDDMTLPEVGIGELPFGPMQAFYFVSGSNDAPCEQAPESGILLQTPDGIGTVKFRVNEVNIELGSTAYLQTQDNTLTIAIVEGQAFVEAQGIAQYVPAGTVVDVQLDDDNLADSTPSFPRAYDADKISKLPYILLIEDIVPAAPLTPELIEEEIEEAEEIVAEATAEVGNPLSPVAGLRVQNTQNSAIVFENGPATTWAGTVDAGDTGTALDLMQSEFGEYILVQWDNGLLGWIGNPFLIYIG